MVKSDAREPRPSVASEERTEVSQRMAVPAAPEPEPTEQLSAQAAPPGAKRSRRPTRKPLDFSENHRIGRFELLREIARGGMGQVFLARDTKLGRKVAIKFLLHGDAEFVQRFLVEARATARCTHENIITIFEVGEHEGLPYMVLEFLDGKTLSEVLATKPSLRLVTELLVPVVRALERAHEHGIVHRDLKPSNIFVTDRGQVKVLDFGVARILDRASVIAGQQDAPLPPDDDIRFDEDISVTYTGSNSIVGTLPYMSPEQWGVDVVDHLSDLWAVGIMFWRALTTVHPAGTTAPEKLRARLSDLDTPMPSFATARPDIPAELAAIVDRCLAKRKRDRYQTASELLADLQRFLAPRAESKLGDVCPYRGLAAFGEEDAGYFFGRSNEIRTAVAQLATQPLLAVIGPSGVGKSSFVHAGLVPAVRAAGGSWQVRVLRPGRAPLQRLGHVLEESLATGEQQSDLAGQLVGAPGLFGELLRRAAERRAQKVLVVVDQLEELFTLCDDDETRGLFLSALLAAADDPTSPVRVVLSMRADFLDRLAGHKHFLAELSRGLFFLSAPDRDNLRETIVRPAELAGVAFEDPWIVDDMLQAATARGALPLVSFAAARLWEARDRERRLLTVRAYNEMGGVGGAFARHADQVATAVPPQSQKLLRAILTRLVTPEGTRAVVERAELLSLSDDHGEVARILDQLVAARLIHLHSDADQVTTVEIVHEMLITEWPTLRRWLDDSQVMRGFIQELRQAAKQWDAHNRSNDLVWRGATAQEALAHAKRHVLDLLAVEKEYLAAVGRLATRARRRKALALAAIIGALGLVIAGGSIAVVRIKLAEGEAQEKAAAATGALADAKAARDQLQGKLDIIEAEKKARGAAERQSVEAERSAAAARGAEELSRDQLEVANRELHRKVLEAQAAKDKAQAAETLAQRATREAKEARATAEALLAKERATREKLQRQLKHIDQRDLK